MTDGEPMMVGGGAGQTFREVLDGVLARSNEDRDFGYFDDVTRTWHQLEGDASCIAGSLVELGLQRGQKLALYARNCAEWLDIWLAAPRAGAITVPVNVANSGDFLIRQLRDTESRIVFTEHNLLHHVLAATASVPTLHTIVVRGDLGAAPRQFSAVKLVSSDQLYQKRPDSIAGGRDLAWNEPSSIIYTSGTTGAAKGVVVSQGYLLHGGAAVAEGCGLTNSDRVFGALPLFHIGGSAGHVLASMVAGSSVVVDGAFRTVNCWNRIRDYDATVLLAPTAAMRMLLSQPVRRDDRSLPLRLILTGAVPPALHALIEDRYNCRVRSIYGMTEAFPLCIQPAAAVAVAGSLGRVNPRFDIRLVDAEGRVVSRGQPGEIACRPKGSGYMFSGYHRVADQTSARADTEWFRTGDIAREDPDGNLFFVGRIKDTIRRRGENISAFEVEQIVLACDGVQECAAFGVASDVSGEEVKVCVVTYGAAQVTLEALIRHCIDHLPRFAVPRYIEFVSSLPKTATGRVRKDELRSQPLGASTWDAERGRKSGTPSA